MNRFVRVCTTYTGAGHAHDGQRLQDARRANDPGETQEEDDPQDVLEAGQVHTHEGPHLRALEVERGKEEEIVGKL